MMMVDHTYIENLDIKKVDECRDAIKGTSVPIQIGFNRRFDNSHSKLQQANINNEIGNLEMLIITSRDPEPPGLDYLKAAGGFFRDTTIHDFDLARFIFCLLYTSPSPRDKRQSRMPSSA